MIPLLAQGLAGGRGYQPLCVTSVSFGVLILMCGHSYNTAEVLRAKALAEDMKDPRSHTSTTAGVHCRSLRRENRAREHFGGLTAS
ncbi:MAG: hypothetical protein KatS3mg058_1510 [Roseiflexus sp.]|nr:MAG: hypothetical protein KatS3mg058_1510 [Roseiflexus sp.]